MINKEEAQKELQQIRQKDWRKQRLEKIQSLPEKLRDIGLKILADSSQTELFNGLTYYEFYAAAVKQLDSLESEARIQIFSLIFPQFFSTVERTWKLFSQLPYQIGYQRKAFRLPHNPEFFSNSRCQWLMNLLQVIEGYEQELTWFAAWTPYLHYYSADTLGILFAAAIDEENEQGEEIFRILIASAKGEHPIGAMGRHVTRALLLSSCSQGWEFIENLLLAAQRQEGLRQVILETVDEAHPEAFRRIIRLILDHDLIRFSATVRAVDTWLGLGLQSANNKLVHQILTQVNLFLEDGNARMAALKSDVPQTVYLSLWTLGFEDAISAIPYATKLLNHPQAEMRFVTVYFLTQLGITQAKIALFPALADGDLRVASQALMAISYSQELGTREAIANSNLFEILEEILPNFPQKNQELKSIVWDWIKFNISRRTVAEILVKNLGERTPKRLISYISLLEPYTRSNVAEKLAQVQPWDDEIRETLFSLVGDSSQWVRQRVIQVLSKCKISTEEIINLEKLLTRKSGDLRRGILQLFLNQADGEIIVTAQRLLQAKNSLQRQAGLELLQEMIQQQRQITKCQDLAQEYQDNHPQIPEGEIQRLKTILAVKNQEPTLEDGLGLVNINELTPSVNPQIEHSPLLESVAATACLTSLDELINEHRQTPITLKDWQGTREELLGNVNWGFPYPNANLTSEKDGESLLLRDVWDNWYQQRSPELRDEDGLELVRAIGLLSQAQSLSYYRDFNPNNFLSQLELALENLESKQTLFAEIPQLKYPYIVKAILTWLTRLYPPKNLLDFLLDASAASLTSIPWEIIKVNRNSLWQINDSLVGWLKLTESLRSFFPSNWQKHHQIRFWQLIQWVNNQSLGNLYFYHNKVQEMMATYHAGGINKADIMANFIVAKAPNIEEILANNSEAKDNSALLSQLRTPSRDFNDLAFITRRKSADLDPILKEIGDRLRQRILEIELQRGDIPTVVSPAALALGSITGIAIIINILQALGKNTLIRGYTSDNLSKSAIFSHLIRVSFPAVADTPQEFAKQAKSATIPQESLIDLAFYAPQWCSYVEQALGWKNFAEAVWWIHAHTKDNSWHVAAEIRDTWIAQVSERTPLSAQNLIDGAVDVEWFNRINQDLTAERWQKIREAAKYASGGAAHKRAQLFAEAILGEIETNTLITRITEKRHQDAVRALGLVPLSRGKQREKDLWQRYQIIQEFIRTSRKFGSQRQASEKLAAIIALENLARTAGYQDPQRLEWAMESQSVADLVDKPQTVTIDEVSVSLAITEGEPIITINKQGKEIKSIPSKIAKNPDIVALKNRKQEINRQALRMRVSLEDAMCRGDNFTPEELQQLCQHPVLLPIINELILIGEGEIGYLAERGKVLQNYQGEITPIKSSFLRIAHPYDLFVTGEWHLWQQECFTKERKQTFKQVFRELYLLTPAEKATDTFSNRYEGHQVNPRQALALLGKRGWITCPEEGVRKTFHNAGISVWLSFVEGFYTPAEVEGLTLQGVSFTKQGEWKPLKLIDIPPQLFSEVMRDLDLVVSVAHQGGVDPEASLSTVEMRTTLVRETCRLLKLDNVQLQSSHVLIEGKIGSYSVHLGSAIVHRQPGGALCIIPVSSQHRGRLFLPFVDDDPKTAEVVSKVLLLAKDQEIKDSTILEQILA